MPHRKNHKAPNEKRLNGDCRPSCSRPRPVLTLDIQTRLHLVEILLGIESEETPADSDLGSALARLNVERPVNRELLVQGINPDNLSPDLQTRFQAIMNRMQGTYYACQSILEESNANGDNRPVLDTVTVPEMTFDEAKREAEHRSGL